MPKFEIGERIRHSELGNRLGTIADVESILTMAPRYEVRWDDYPSVTCQHDEHRLSKISRATVRDGWEMPPTPAWSTPVAVSHDGIWECYFSGPEDDDMGAIEWPFVEDFATVDDFVALGFEVA